MTSAWLELLRKAVGEAGGNKAAVARALGCSRTSVSLLLAEKYPGNTNRMASLIVERYARVDCPHTGKSESPDLCRKFAGPVPTSSPAALRQWRACRACPHAPATNPATKEAASC